MFQHLPCYSDKYIHVTLMLERGSGTSSNTFLDESGWASIINHFIEKVNGQEIFTSTTKSDIDFSKSDGILYFKYIHLSGFNLDRDSAVR